MKIEIKINDKIYNVKKVINFLYALLGVVIMVSILVLSATAIAEGSWIKDNNTLKIILNFWVSGILYLFGTKWYKL